MKEKNPFDKALDIRKGIPDSMRNAAIYVTETLDLSWAAAQAIFEDQAKPEHALKLLEIFLAEDKSEFYAGLLGVRRQGNDNGQES